MCTKFSQNWLRNVSQKIQMATTNFSFFDIWTSDRGDFPRIIVIALCPICSLLVAYKNLRYWRKQNFIWKKYQYSKIYSGLHTLLTRSIFLDNTQTPLGVDFRGILILLMQVFIRYCSQPWFSSRMLKPKKVMSVRFEFTHRVKSRYNVSRYKAKPRYKVDFSL